jgi:lactate dehydrogenase-like 2-hydroxyacid dehydrogenase
LTETTADLVVALTLATARRIPEASHIVKNGEWPATWKPFFMVGKDLHSSIVGIIGLGAIGLGLFVCLFVCFYFHESVVF